MNSGRAGDTGTEPSLAGNAVYSGAQALGTAVLLFLSYRFLLRNLTPDDFGLWALLISVAGVARLADFGVGAAASRFVALDIGRDAKPQAVQLLQSLALATALLSAGMALLVGFASPLILSAVVPEPAMQSARELLPLMLANLVLTLTGTALLGGLEGTRRFDVRAVVVLAANVVFLAGCVLLTRRHGLLGVGVAQVLQGAVLALGAWFAARSVLGFDEWWPRSVSLRQLRRVLNFGVSFQVIAALQLVTELLFKALLTQRVGLSAAGLFEIAQRVPMLLRAPLVAASQVLLPAVASRPDEPQLLAGLYGRSTRLVGFATLAVFGSLLVAWPLLDVLLMGGFDRDLYAIALLMAIGWGLNLLAVPAYFSLLGSGSTVWNVWSHAVIAGGVLLLYAATPASGRLEVLVAGYAASLVLGSYVVVVGLHRRVAVKLRDCVAPGTGVALVLVVALSALTATVVPIAGTLVQWIVTGLALGLFAVSLLPGWRRLGPDLPATLLGRR